MKKAPVVPETIVDINSDGDSEIGKNLRQEMSLGKGCQRPDTVGTATLAACH
jgi:hypothetical protein